MLIYSNLLAGLVTAVFSVFSGASAVSQGQVALVKAPVADEAILETETKNAALVPVFNGAPTTIPSVPFFSQIRDISSPKWQKLSCGVADLAMIINFYKPDTVSPDTLLADGIEAGAFIDGAGWSHQGLVNLAHPYGFEGRPYDFSGLTKGDAFAALENILEEGPVVASVYYTFDPKSPIPHLVVINGFANGFVYYNDPATQGANQKISVDGFLRGWKKRIIVVRPLSSGAGRRAD